MTAALIGFPQVFGWVHFVSVPGNFASYSVVLFGFPAFDFGTESALGCSCPAGWSGRRCW